MKRIGLAWALLALSLLPAAGSALTMEEAVGLARGNNPRLRDFRNRTEAQKWRVDSRKAPFWPEIDVSYNYERRENVFSFFQTRDASTFTGEISYNLFRGFSDLNALQSARSTLDAFLYEQRTTEADVVLDVKRAWIRLLRAGKTLEVSRESVMLLERQSHDAERFWRAGLTAKNEYLKVEVELASARQDLLQAETDVRVAREALDKAVGASVGKDAAIEDIDFVEPADLDEEALSRAMLSRRSELKFLEAQRAAREYARDSLRGGYFPSVDLSVEHSRFGETFAFEGMPDPLFDSDTSAMVEAKWNLFEGWRTRKEILAEESEVRAITERHRETRDALLLQLKTAVEEYRVSAGRIDLARKSVEQAEENYRITENQYRERVATSTDLLDARVFLSRARNEYHNAIYNLSLARAVLERVVEGPLEMGPPGGESRGN
ncbi:MAG TPA: TolC family protein [Candidatus Deferrimicrobiaceae bacterium]|nr:TolC family protein [Candidatus Deferrimicrobiaceae bacterium]